MISFFTVSMMDWSYCYYGTGSFLGYKGLLWAFGNGSTTSSHGDDDDGIKSIGIWNGKGATLFRCLYVRHFYSLRV